MNMPQLMVVPPAVSHATEYALCARRCQAGREHLPEEGEACRHRQNGDESAARGQPATAERDDDKGGGAKGGD